MAESDTPGSSTSLPWYDLFSRGARDWLRHNDKVRESVRGQLPRLLSDARIVDTRGGQRLRVPVRLLEHYRFTLNRESAVHGVGQGEVEPGDVLRQARRPGGGDEAGAGGNAEGGIEFVVELTVDDVVDWLWEELELPNLEDRQGGMQEDELVREGWDRRGARSRLDRRRSLKESIKRRAVVRDGPLVSNDDLRFRQLVERRRPAQKAVVFFIMDVSASMTQRDRQLAKTFFFWVVQGLRRQYRELECEFVAHTERAWRFAEHEFFEVAGSGGTIASSAYVLVADLIRAHYTPAAYNIYTFYASDGHNFPPDRDAAGSALAHVCAEANFSGFLEVATAGMPAEGSEMMRIFNEVARTHPRTGSSRLRRDADVWDAIKAFFARSAQAA
ncbi:MAG: DUF444 family protein [Gammaproteobacteria bacterium]